MSGIDLTEAIEAVVMDDELPFRCRRCGSFVRAERLHEADDFGPAPCHRCKARTAREQARIARTRKDT